jgi:adenine-specific DNA-methyltransferase
MLINFPDTPFDDYPEFHKEYIRNGEKNKQHEGYKCSIRDRWYIVPSVWVPDAFFLRRNNFYPKFVLNKCGAVSTDTMHRMKFNADVDADNVLLSYYNSISFAFTEICGRSYGGGVLEILPGEMGNIVLPKVENIDATLKKRLLKHIDKIVRENQDIEIVLDVVDHELLVDALGIEPELCVKCHKIWKTLQKRRLGRGEKKIDAPVNLLW